MNKIKLMAATLGLAVIVIGGVACANTLDPTTASQQQTQPAPVIGAPAAPPVVVPPGVPAVEPVSPLVPIGAPATESAERVMALMTHWLAKEHDLVCLGSLGFENSYDLGMKRERAEALSIRTAEDLAKMAPELKLCSDYEFFSRPEWYQLRDTYGFKFKELVQGDSSFMYRAVAEGEVDVITAFSSDGRIAAYDLVLLDDPKLAFPPYDAILLTRREAAERPGLVEALQPLIGAISAEDMGRANLMVDRKEDKKTIQHHRAGNWRWNRQSGDQLARPDPNPAVNRCVVLLTVSVRHLSDRRGRTAVRPGMTSYQH